MALALWLSATPAVAQQAMREFNIPAGNLGPALNAFARQANQEIMFSSTLVADTRTNGVQGRYEPRGALAALLRGTGLEVASDTGSVVTLRRSAVPQGEAGAAPASEVAQVAEIVVTGSRIRGVAPSSPVIVISQDAMRNAGDVNLGDTIRRLPQNFSGGQNAGISGVAGNNGNANSSAQLNLRGLGPDATLTLLNGHRLSYDSVRQGVDITAVPLDAVERIEIVTDGASALYGSDAVGGVANIILKTDYTGLSTTARLGAATDGGFEQQQYSILGGKAWSGGGVVATVNYEKSTAVTARERSYASAMNDEAILYPPIETWGGVVSAHQVLNDWAKVSIDAIYNRRDSFQAVPYTKANGYLVSGSAMSSSLKSYALSPNLELSLPHGWTGDLSMTYSRDSTDQVSITRANSLVTSQVGGFFDNGTEVYEASFEGPVASLPAGEARLALGGGLRHFTLERWAANGGSFPQSGRSARYAFGELHVPLIGPAQDITGVKRLDLSLAGRYEDYGEMGDLFVPKVGLDYVISPKLELKGSWGKSFKAPTLNQQYMTQASYYYPAYYFGTGYPTTQNIIYRSGGNTDLKTERATTWTVGGTLRPFRENRAQLTVSYFNIDYRDRVASPITSSTGALDNPLYSALVIHNPSTAQLSQLAAETPFQDVFGQGINLSTVVAILDARYQNVARQKIQGVDLDASYPWALGAYGDLTAQASVTYLSSKQAVNAGQPMTDLSGTIFNPAKTRARVGLEWSIASFVLAPAANYTGALKDIRATGRPKITSQVTYDVTARYRLNSALAWIGDLELSASVLNLTNAPPKPIVVSPTYYPAFETTNYTAIGRSISVALTKRW